jgi:hypothetical protein
MLLEKFIYPTFGDVSIDRISTDDVNHWYDGLAPGRETIRAQAYSLLRTIFTTAASERPQPLIPYNPAHISGAATPSGSTRSGPRLSKSSRRSWTSCPRATS